MQQTSVLYRGSWQCCKPALGSVNVRGTVRFAVFLLVTAEVAELDCQQAISHLLGAWLAAPSMSAGRAFIRTGTASCCSDLPEITAMFCTRACGWTASVQCLRAAGCGEGVFILVVLIFYLNENKIHVLTLPELSCRWRRALVGWWGWRGQVEHTGVSAFPVLNWR